ncbi:hypothetical protein JXD38_01485 [candidate division WOR-3 bacterium]|nr:hypothetical protein [candidate division WOR-3 bacterium]
MRIVLLVLAIILPASAVLYNIDEPVPISLAHAEYYISGRLWGEGGIMMRFGFGLWNRVTLGMSYGGNYVLGPGAPRFFDRYRPDFQARIAILQEQGYTPNLLLGFESQGYDDCSLQVYQVREKGAYLCAGKTFDAIRSHCQLGLNYWDGFNAFLAVNTLLPGSVELMLEYDPAFNDRGDVDHGLHPGYFNFGVGVTIAEKVRMVLGLRDVFGYKKDLRFNRVLEVSVNDRF